MARRFRAALLLLLLVAAAVPGARAKVGKKPNFIVWMNDDVSYKEYGFAGNKDNKTPYLDAMAHEGVHFARAWSTPICQPTRAMLMTGEYATTTMWWDQSSDQPLQFGKEVGTFAHVAKDAGYRTLMVGKWQLLFSPPNNLGAKTHGFDSYCLWYHSDVEGVGQVLDRWVKDLGGDPVIPVSAGGTDEPNRFWNPPIVRHLGKDKHKLLDLRGDKLAFAPQIYMDCIRDFIAESKDKPFFIYFADVVGHRQYDRKFDEYTWIQMPIVNKKFEVIGREKKKGTLASNVEYSDVMAGRLRKIITDADVKDNTVLFFMSDNASANYGKGHWKSEFGVHVPLIAWGGPVKRRQKPVKRMVSLIDIYATVADWTGGRQLAGHNKNFERKRKHSISLVPILCKHKLKVRRRLNIAYRTKDRIIMRNNRFIFDGEDNLWDCSGGRDERTCEEVKNAKSKYPAKVRKFLRKREKFLSGSIRVTRF